MRVRLFGLLMLVGVGVIPLVVAGYYANRRATQTALEAIQTGNQRVAERAARRVHALVEAEIDRLRASASGLAPAVAASPAQGERIAKNFLILFPHLRPETGKA